jgi:hypothetical protein
VIKVKVEAENLDWFLRLNAGQKALSEGLTEFTMSLFRSVHRVIDEGKSFTPRTGHLQQSIRVDLSNVKEGKAEIVADASYAPFVEFGTKSHTIKPKKRKMLKWVIDKEKCEELIAQGKMKPRKKKKNGEDEGICWISKKEVHHPGSKPYPFFRTAVKEGLEEAKREFVKAFLSSLRRE